MGVKHVKGNTVSENGCTVEVDGDVVYTIIPPRIVGFRGVIHIKGGKECPNGDLHFNTENKVKENKTNGEIKPE